MSFSGAKSSKFFLNTLSYILLTYNFHRYIFQYNSETTSPTYTDTPMIWQVGKYILIFLVLFLYYFTVKISYKNNKFFFITYSFISFILLVNIFNRIYYNDFNFNELEYCLYYILLIPFWFTKDPAVNIDRIIYSSAIVLFAANIFAVGNFLIFGRLPALGYEGGLVRFGSFWDDPNGYGTVCVFLYYYFLFKSNKVLAIAALVNIIITFSFSCYLVLCVGSIFWLLQLKRDYMKNIILPSVLIFLFAVGLAVYNIDKIVLLYEQKSSSIEAHLDKKMEFNLYPLESVGIQFNENWFLSALYNYFPFSILMLLGVLLLLINIVQNKHGNILLRFCLFLLLCESFFIPIPNVFPLNFLLLILLVVYFKNQLSGRRPVVKKYISQSSIL